MRSRSTVTHPLGKRPAGSWTLVQEPGRAEQGQRKTLDDEVGHWEKELLALPFSSREALELSYSSQFMMLHRVLAPSSCPGSGLRTPASTVPLPPRAAAFGRLRDSSSLHALPILKTNRRRRLPAALVGLPPARASRRLGSLLAGLGRDARAVTPHSRCRSLGAPRTRAVCLASALPPSVSPPVLRCSVRIARL